MDCIPDTGSLWHFLKEKLQNILYYLFLEKSIEEKSLMLA
jgi:hypothetical protein